MKLRNCWYKPTCHVINWLELHLNITAKYSYFCISFRLRDFMNALYIEIHFVYKNIYTNEVLYIHINYLYIYTKTGLLYIKNNITYNNTSLQNKRYFVLQEYSNWFTQKFISYFSSDTHLFYVLILSSNRVYYPSRLSKRAKF